MSFLRLLVLVTAAFFSSLGHAQGYPTRPVKIVVPFPPGGTNDILARIMAERLQNSLGQSFIVENRAGAAGFIGAASVARSAPDGYTLLLSASGPLAVALKLNKDVQYDAARDFTPIAIVGEFPMVLVANPAFKGRTVADVIAYAKANPGQLKFGLPALGTMHHLMTEYLRLRGNVSINMIPYKGSGQTIVDLLGGQIDMHFDNLPAVNEYIKSGRMRAIAVASPKRIDILPNTPTFVESGFPDLVAAPWNALVAPAGTPPEIVRLLNAEVLKIMRTPATRTLVEKQGVTPVFLSPEETRTFMNSEIEKWARIVTESGAKAE